MNILPAINKQGFCLPATHLNLFLDAWSSKKVPNSFINNSTSWRRFLPSSIRSGVLFGTLGLVSWLSGIPLLWPSLGPTAYVLAFEQETKHSFKKVFGAHTMGTLSGFVAHQIFAPALTIGAISHPMDPTGIKIAISAIVALSLTAGLMRGTGWTHSPACATTLIVALGLISTAWGVIYIPGAVILIYGIHLMNERLFRQLGWTE